MELLASLTQTEVSLLVATLGPLVHDQERARSFVQWVDGPSSARPSDAIDAVFCSYMAWNLGVQAVREPSDPYSSDELGRRAGNWFARGWKALPSGGSPWGLLCKEIMNTEFDFVLRVGSRWMIFEFKIVQNAPLPRLPLAEQWQLRRQALAACIVRDLLPGIDRVDHFYVSNFGGPDFTLEMTLEEPVGKHFVAPKYMADLATQGDPALAALTRMLNASPVQKVRHLSWLAIVDYLGTQEGLAPLSRALRSNVCLFARRGSRP